MGLSQVMMNQQKPMVGLTMRTMNEKKVRRVIGLVFRLTICLTASACRTNRNVANVATPDTAETPAPLARDSAQAVIQKMQGLIIPEMTFRPPATIIDAVNFLTQASRDYDKPGTPPELRGVHIKLCLPNCYVTDGDASFGGTTCTNGNVSVISAMSARFISLYDALKLVCDVTGMKIRIYRDLVMIVPHDNDEGELVTRSYNLPPSFCGVYEKIHDSHSDQPVWTDRTSEWKTWLESMGVTWPEGSSVAHLAAIGKLRVTNLPQNLSLIEKVLNDLNDSSRQINVEVAVASFRLRDVEKLMMGGDVSCERLMALRKKGKANLVSTACVITKSGQEAIAKSVHEVPFPPEKARTAFVNTNVVTAVEEKTHLNRFTTQEIGMILRVVPTTWANGESIDLLLNPQWLTLNRWEKYPVALTDRWHSSAEPLRQPVFESMSFQTQVTVRNGETILLGGSSTPDGERVYYGFLTVTLVDVQSTNQPK